MIQYRMARKEERNDFVDLANYTFGFNIETLLPKVYHEDDDSHKITVLAENEQGKLVAEAAVLPQVLHVTGKTLHANYLGIMVVHHRHRGEGHMKAIMKKCIEDMKGKTDLSVLSGLRQRYEYFGYTSGGVYCQYTINKANVRHALGNADSNGITFVPYEKVEDGESFVSGVNESRIAYVERSHELMDKILICYNQTPFIIFCGDKKLGYLLTGKNGSEISEMALLDSGDTRRVIKAYFETFPVEHVTVAIPEYESELHEEFSAFAEMYEIMPASMFRIFDFVNVIEAFLTLKFQTIGISHGRFSAIMDGQPVTIMTDTSGVCVDRQADADAVILSQMDAQKLVLTPYGRYMDVTVPRDWFPLPLFWYTVDSF